MHMTIRAIVYAETEEEAVDQGHTVFAQLSENGGPFDYYRMQRVKQSVLCDIARALKMDNGELEDGEGALAAESYIGRKLIENGMAKTEDEFHENVSKVRLALNTMTDEELLNEAMVRYHMARAGQDAGSTVWLYGH